MTSKDTLSSELAERLERLARLLRSGKIGGLHINLDPEACDEAAAIMRTLSPRGDSIGSSGGFDKDIGSSAALPLSSAKCAEAGKGSGARFPNLARHEPFPDDVVADVTAQCTAELEAAGIDVHTFGILLGKSEVPSKAVGQLSKWGFRRAWYYWVAEGPGLPVEVAERLHATHGKVVRVDGHCGCPSPREWFNGFGVGCYHVDSPDGLKALADALRSVEAANATPLTTEARYSGDGSYGEDRAKSAGKEGPASDEDAAIREGLAKVVFDTIPDDVELVPGLDSEFRAERICESVAQAAITFLRMNKWTPPSSLPGEAGLPNDKARIERLEEALKPFAKLAIVLDEIGDGLRPPEMTAVSQKDARITYGDLRLARALTRGKP